MARPRPTPIPPPLLAWQQMLEQQQRQSRPLEALPSPTEQLKSLTLKLGQQTGALLEQGAQIRRPIFALTLSHALHTSLQMANVMNIDVGPRLLSSPPFNNPPQSGQDTAFAMSPILGRMGKAMEATDHFENYPSRQEMERACVDMAALLLTTAHTHRLKLKSPALP